MKTRRNLYFFLRRKRSLSKCSGARYIAGDAKAGINPPSVIEGQAYAQTATHSARKVSDVT